MQLTRALQWLHFTVAVVAMAAMGWNATAQTAGPAAKNKAPTASITSPANNTSFPAGSNITITATASDSDGTIDHVDFLAGTTVIGTSGTAPYSFTWLSVAAGTYSLTARATDNLGAPGTSTAVSITVTPNAPPTVSITAPANGASYVAPASVVISANAADSNGTVTRVEFFQGTTSLGFVTSPPYTVTWSGVAAGSYVLTAKATDNQNAVTTSAPVSISVGAPPLVVMTSPDNCTTVSPPASVTLAADAIDLDGWITSVDFLDGTTLIGTATRLPYSVTFSNVAQGTHTLTARATNNLGITATSTAITLNCTAPNQLPTVSIMSPANGATFRAGGTVTITASASDPDGTVTQVAFYRSGSFIASSNGPVFSVSWTNIPAGTWSLTAIATDNRGGSTTSAPVSVTVQPNALPTAHLTAPANGASYRAPATIDFTATAADSDGTVSKVDFLLNGNQVATSNTAPYAATATNVAAGTYSVVARATDNDGATGNSPEIVSITVAANALPNITITSPANGASFTAPVDIPVTASASDSDGTITKVEFFDGTTLLATLTAPPYNFTWVNVMPGAHQLNARATDDTGGTRTATANITVAGTAAQITAPAEGARFPAPAGYTITTFVATSSGTITMVEFFDGATLIGTANFSAPSATINLPYSSVPAGTHVHTVRATHSTGTTVTSPPRTVVVFAPPSVTVTAPAAGSFYVAPAVVNLSAAPSDFANPVSRVDFYAGGTLIGTSQTSPFEFTWGNAAAGNYAITATATDSTGVSATSPPVSIEIASAPSVTAAPGLDGAVVGEASITVRGTTRTEPNSSVTVNGVPAQVGADGAWVLNDVPLVVGANTLTLAVTTIDGATSSTTITVNRSGASQVTLRTNATTGIASLPVELTISISGISVKKVEFDFLGGGPLQDITSFGSSFVATYNQPGMYSPRIVVTDNNDVQYTSRSVGILVRSVADVQALLQGVMDGMLDRLKVSDSDRALNRTTGTNADRNRDIFQTMVQSGQNATLKAEFGTFHEVVLNDNMAEVFVMRASPDGNAGFWIYLIRGSDGIWRIDEM
jgi:hypothetical protein